MGRKKLYDNKIKHPYSLVHTIEAIIADYPRRDRIIRFSSASEETLSEYRRLNDIIDNVISETSELELARIVKNDIIERLGYEKSRAHMLSSKCTYYNLKRKIIHCVAVNMHLVDKEN